MAEVSTRDPATDRGGEGREALWAAVRSVLRAQRTGPPLERIARDAPPPASFAQEGLWFLERLAPDTPVHNETLVCRFRGSLSVGALEASLSEIVRRHEALRTTLRSIDGQLVQIVHAPAALQMPVVDISSFDAARRDVEAKRLAFVEARVLFDLDRGPLLRTRLLRLSEREHWLVLSVHHLAFDGWSFDVLMRELGALYRAFVAGLPSPLPDLPLQYADFAHWQRRWLTGDARRHLVDYWTQRLSGATPSLNLRSDRPRGTARSRRGACRSLRLPDTLTVALKRLGDDEGATPFMTYLAAFQALLYRYTGVEDIVVGAPVANRNRMEFDGLVGLFANTLAFRTSVAGQPSFRELLARVRDTVLGAYAHQDLPFEILAEALRVEQRTRSSPMFDVMFAFQNLPKSAWVFPELQVDAWNVDNATAKFDITLFVLETDDGLSGWLEYDTDRFDDARMADLLEHFHMLLDGIVRDPDQSVAALPLATPNALRRLLREHNDTTADYPRDRPIHEVFEAQVRRNPGAPALAFPGGQFDYQELDRRANRLARHLQASGVAPRARVGVLMMPSPSLIVALLAILKTGAAYVPVDPTSPATRLAGMLRRADVNVLVSDTTFAPRVAGLGFRVVDVDRERRTIDAALDAKPGVDVSPSDPAYVMFTSGSTGAPKGVCIPHRGVVRLVNGANYADLGADDVFLQLANVSFDASTFEIWGALLNGATLALPQIVRPSLQQIGQAIRRHRVSILWLGAGLFEAFVDDRLDDLATVRQLLTGGDVVSPTHAERFLREMPACRLVNCYGPTENTTFSTFYPVENGRRAEDGALPIGRPVSNTQIYVLDAGMEPVPPGLAGELYVGGDGLMLGYVDDDAAGEALVANPFDDRPGAMLYRTGDLVSFRRDGNLEFLGRTDLQLKIRGFRVEPGEVEEVMCRSALVQRAAVIARGHASGEKHLVAYVVPAPAAEARGDVVPALRDFVRAHLPESHVPSAFIVVPAIPLTANGKVDRDALPPPPARPAADGAILRVAPRDDTERAVAQAFARMLGVDSVGRDDDFFDLGGNSLTALRLIAALEEHFASALPLVALYEHPTVAGLAGALRCRDDNAPAVAAGGGDLGPTLVEIKRGGSGAPFFLVPGGHGGMVEMTLYAKLMRHLGSDRPVYGLLARGVDGHAEPDASVADMAAAFIREMRRVHPRGPYAFGGECVGGVVAYEMAQQLRSNGQEVALLLMMDTWCPSFAASIHYRCVVRPLTLLRDRRIVARRGYDDVRRVLRDHVRDRPPFHPVRSLRYAINVARTLKRVADPWISAVRRIGKPEPGTERVAAAGTNYIALAMRYRPRAYAGRVALVVSSANRRLGLADGWRPFVGDGLGVIEAPGDHESYIRDTPEATATLVRACLDEALAHG